MKIGETINDLLKATFKDTIVYQVVCFLILNQRYDLVTVYQKELRDLIREKIIVRNPTTKALELNPAKLEESEDLDHLITEYRNLWHYSNTGVAGKMGNKKEVVKRFKKFILDNDITGEQLIQLAQHYINNFREISGYLQQADYFLYKEKLINGQRQTESRAQALLDEYDDFILDQNEFE